MPTDKKITLAKYAGFCYGVKRAVETVKKLKADNPDKNICILGELIHNTQVIEELDKMGIKTLDELLTCGDRAMYEAKKTKNQKGRKCYYVYNNKKND